VREFLSEHNIPFVERNIRQDLQAKEELLRLTGKLVVPAFAVDGEWFFGYDPERLGSLVSRYRVS
jgi:2-hydroxychromene-2-carboxylate isomerase